MGTTIRPTTAGADRLPYQRHALSFKRKLVALTLVPGASVARLAREHGVNANQVFSWRKLYREGQLGPIDSGEVRLLPVDVAPPTMAAGTKPGEADQQGKPCRGRLRIECAHAHLIIEGSPDAQALRVVLEHLLR
jgi:transposase-like protein